ncbi:23S rRNA (adenine(2030)-N(6))-methyltransferase RlmJ [Cronobacter sakazakii]|uniref:Ribosomal RNA large subunit methyltransferase J n=1 Tax=Cronobacter sakazakii TaxID=28141 RepID=A0AAN5X325_CROSK|nr:23S rRNA (adenine(2030)-N(6))-methyltransferase RlmJ [Cronobacter sakazakii]EGT4275220.1 23S rRNA (adenine(2030)-N(6))-methyltransferase RlmJ [Cronobacter sakazakii]EGT5693902.1 23S rRNA (adenine(2030)-N(6))-methyltransferase RlmJ [Cronobacter sakazakii]EGT5702727.1 23S rRNA (adenine(2030)-N(6))-methyltransferase RlmJ [Cronobacter sakazakii]EGT5719191.1 23S rRNA (adenine(2030)-N(6))-methyltransferase RlmJ [Cronobacter sakazakii]EGT5723812.1 23S rRNA (adenine(2030)-N(6))-methyltransferase Rl
MLSYRHSFHAGNHADVLKHTVQSLIIESLKEKEKPFLYLDTHAGAGRYLLSGEHAERTGEYLEGIARIWQRDDLPAELAPYISAVSHFNRSGQLRYYPGSPLIARQLLRPQDSLQLTELHPSDFPLLRGEFQKDERARVERADGYQQLKSKLPPASRRGLILIDPPYEIKTDYQAVVQGISEGYKRFATGVYALWYPVVLRNQIKRMMNDLEATGIRRILQIELAIRPDSDQRGMTASGMIVINPPWKLEQQMATLLPWLHKALVPAGTGHTTLKWVVPE